MSLDSLFPLTPYPSSYITLNWDQFAFLRRTPQSSLALVFRSYSVEYGLDATYPSGCSDRGPWEPDSDCQNWVRTTSGV